MVGIETALRSSAESQSAGVAADLPVAGTGVAEIGITELIEAVLEGLTGVRAGPIILSRAKITAHLERILAGAAKIQGAVLVVALLSGGAGVFAVRILVQLAFVDAVQVTADLVDARTFDAKISDPLLVEAGLEGDAGVFTGRCWLGDVIIAIIIV